MKVWKITQIVGFLLLALGVVIRAGAGEFYGTWMAVIGLLVWAAGKTGAWLKSDKA